MCDGSNYGEGQTFVGVAQVQTNNGGDWANSITLPGETAAPDAITATATRFTEPGVSDAGATSEFSRCLVAPPPPSGATVTYQKETVPASDPQDFGFVASGGGMASDTLDTDAGSATPSSHTDTLTRIPTGGQQIDLRIGARRLDVEHHHLHRHHGDPQRQFGQFYRLGWRRDRLHVHEHEERIGHAQEDDERGRRPDARTSCSSSPARACRAPGSSRSTFGDQDGVLEFGSGNLIPGQTYKICETPVPAGFTSFWKLDGVIVTPYNPDASKSPPEDLGTRCYDFKVAPGQARAFEVDNSRPGGDPRTIGYWKNWNRCTGGNQAATAQKNGGAAAGFFLVEDLLPQLDRRLLRHELPAGGQAALEAGPGGKNKSSDAAYELGAQLLAARFNLAAGAETCTAVQQAVLDGQTLLDRINFTGSGDYLGSKSKEPAARPGALARGHARPLQQRQPLLRLSARGARSPPRRARACVPGAAPPFPAPAPRGARG